MSINEILNQLTVKALEYGPKLIGAVLVWVIGNWIIKAFVMNFIYFVLHEIKISEFVSALIYKLI